LREEVAVTAGANEVTAGANGPDLVLAAIVGSVIEAGALAGLDPATLRRQLGLGPADFDDPDALLPLETYIAAWEAITATQDSADLGLRLGAFSSPRLLGALGYAMVHAPSALGAVELFRRYRRLVSDTLAPEIDIDEAHVTYRLVWPARVARLYQFADCAFQSTLTLMREMAGLPADASLAVEACYQCPRPPGPDREKALGCRVRFGAPETRFVLRRDLLERPLPRANSELFEYLERHANVVLARLPEGGSTAVRARRLITGALRGGEPTPLDVAKKLAMSERTLQRRLRDEGTSFAQLLDGVRRELAELYLSEPRVPAHDVAFLIGYSEPSAFYRAFRRWTGRTPQEFRQSTRSAPG
jgi:AraC-like DNA-binding protein